jgi:hypothetical protein
MDGILQGIEWIMFHGHFMFHGHLGCFQKKHLLEVGQTQNRETYGTLNAHNYWFVLFYHVWGPARIEIRWNSIWLRDLVTCDFTLHSRVCDHTTWFWRCVGTAFGHFFFWAFTISWSRLLARVWSGPTITRWSKKAETIQMKTLRVQRD